MIRNLYTLCVIMFFLIMMVLLLRNHVIPDLTRKSGIDVDRRVLTDSWADQDEYQRIKFANTSLGILRTTAEREFALDESGRKDPDVIDHYFSTTNLVLDTSFLKGRVVGAIKMNRRLEFENALIRAYVRPFSGEPMDGEELYSGDLPEGAYELAALKKENTLYLRLRHNDAVQYNEIFSPRPITMLDSVTPILRGDMMTQGAVYTVDVFDPLGNATRQAQLEWVDETIIQDTDGNAQAVRIVETRFGSSASRIYVDDNGLIYRREFPLGMLPGTGEDSGATPENAPKLTLNRIEEPEALGKYPRLNYVPPVADLTIEEMTGKDTGRVIDLNLIDLLSGNIEGLSL